MSEVPTQPRGKPCVVYVEDEESNRVLMQRIADRHGGIRLISAVTGEEGLSLIAQNRPTMVICDGDLPDMSGADVVKRLRQDPTTTDIRIVIVSGTPGSWQDLSSEELLHLMKPVNVKEILALFDEL